MTQTAETTPSGGPTNAPMIRFEGVHSAWAGGFARYGGPYREEALSGLTLTVPAGGIAVLLGDHGSGKTLLALHLLGEVEPDSGRILVGEKSLWELPEPERWALHDSFGLFRGGTSIRESRVAPHETARENLSTHLEKRTGGCTAEKLKRWLEILDLAEVADTKADDLDPGQRRRLALGLALADDPPVVVIDDPGEAMDCRHFEALTGAIRRWHARVGATMLITVHSLRAATELADVVAVLRDGQVIAHGRPDELLAGVDDDESFERKFGEGLGGVAECDPKRTKRAWKRITQHDRRVHIAFVLGFFSMGIILLWVLSSGLISSPFIP